MLNKTKQKGHFTTFGLFSLALSVTAIGGWVANIVKLIGMLDGPVTAMFIARCFGILIAPFGAVLGFF